MDVRHLIHQKSYEQVKHVLRRHPITFVPILLLTAALLLAPVIIYQITIFSFPTLFTNQSVFIATVIGASIYYLSVYLFFFAQFIDFYLDLWILTNDRIIDIEQFGLFSRTISELDLFRVQDVTTDVHGFFATFFRYGNVSIKTASQNLDIVFRDVANPNNIRQEILKLADTDRKFHYPELTDKGVNEV